MKDNLVRWFKSELVSSMTNENIVEELKDKLMILDNQFEAHSPNLSGMHYTPAERDTQLLKYTEKRTAILSQLAAAETRKKQIQGILNLMPSKEKKMILEIYGKKVTWENASMSIGITRKALEKKLYRTIKQAVNNYFDNL